MPPETPSIDALAQAVLDGEAVDWDAAGSGPGDARLVPHLKIVADLAGVHREAHAGAVRPDVVAHDVPRPAQWGHLRIIEPIGRGAFGEVYRAWDTRLDREIALKLMPAEDEAGGKPGSSITSEGRLLARVRHPNVVTIHGADRIDGRIGLWMELVRGHTLEEMIAAGETFEPAEVARIGLELGRAVAAVHAAGLLHRDIKAQNVIRSDDGRVVLMDFGAGRDAAEPASDLTGTPLYLAPEVLRGQPATPRSDVYSLGVLLFHLLTGSYPVTGRTLDDLRRAHEAEGRIGPRDLRPDVPARLAGVVERAIEVRPEARQPTAEALCDDLLAASRPPSRRHLWYGLTAAASLLVAMWLLQSARDPEGPGLPGLADAARAALPPGARPVIAVPPLGNRTGRPELDVVVEGLTHEIVRDLARFDGLSVRVSGAEPAGRDDPDGTRALGRRLGANLVLAGSVTGSSGRLRLTASLVRVADDEVLWAESFDGGDGDPFAIQDALSRVVVNSLRLRVEFGEREYQLSDPALYQVFLRARGLSARRHPVYAEEAVELFEQVIAKNPSFVPALAGLVSALSSAFSRATVTEILPPPDPRLEMAALRAIELDPFLAGAHAAMGLVHARNRDWPSAHASFAHAMQLDPGLTTTHTDYVLSTLLPAWNLDEALRVLGEARERDPESVDVRSVLALVQVEAGLYQDAIESCRWVFARDPAAAGVSERLGRALFFTGETEEAIRIFESRAQRYGYLGYALARLGRTSEARALADAHPESPSRQMLIYAGLGDRERAFAALERTAAANWWRAAAWMYRPEMDVLRGDPRLAVLQRRLRLPV